MKADAPSFPLPSPVQRTSDDYFREPPVENYPSPAVSYFGSCSGPVQTKHEFLAPPLWIPLQKHERDTHHVTSSANHALLTQSLLLDRGSARTGLPTHLDCAYSPYSPSWFCNTSPESTDMCTPSDVHRSCSVVAEDCAPYFSSTSPSGFTNPLRYEDFELVLTPEQMSREHTEQLSGDDDWILPDPMPFSPHQINGTPAALPMRSSLGNLATMAKPVFSYEDTGVLADQMCFVETDGPWGYSYLPPSTPSQASNMQDISFGDEVEQPKLEEQGQVRKCQVAHRQGQARWDCNICGKLFSRSSNYNAHLATHNKARLRPYRCSYPGCAHAFFRPTDLKRHERSVHMKARDYHCRHCGNGFPRKDSLQRHEADGCSSRTSIRRRRHRLEQSLDHRHSSQERLRLIFNNTEDQTSAAGPQQAFRSSVSFPMVKPEDDDVLRLAEQEWLLTTPVDFQGYQPQQ